MGLLPSVLEPFVVTFFIKFSELGIERGFFTEQGVSPDVSFEYRVESKGVVADNLERYGLGNGFGERREMVLLLAQRREL